MRVMVIVKATERSEAGEMPTAEELDAMGRFNTELVDAGIMLAGDGLRPSSQGVRISYEGGGAASATDGPFAETKELVAGFWILEVKSLDEAVEWMRRAPFSPGDTVEIRPFFEAEDFGEVFTPEARAAEEALRARIEEQQNR
ncbi:MAG TPA: YciI family protein [Miltoncostaea sp.]|nr:YciI family protein [Miltoncostaea sp.]